MTTEHTDTAQKSGYRYIGKDRKRVEDPRLLVGRGGYIADLRLPGMLHAAILRSPVPHAWIRSVTPPRH